MRASAQTRVELFSSGGAFPSSPSDLLKANNRAATKLNRNQAELQKQPFWVINMMKFNTSNTTNSKQAGAAFLGPTSVAGRILIGS